MQEPIPKKTELSAIVKKFYSKFFDPASISFASEWRDLVVLRNGFEGGCNFFVLNSYKKHLSEKGHPSA